MNRILFAHVIWGEGKVNMMSWNIHFEKVHTTLTAAREPSKLTVIEIGSSMLKF